MTLYVYYKFVVSEHPMVFRIVSEIQAQLTLEFPELDCGLLKRPNADDEGRETWMEIYRGVATDSSCFIERLDQLALKNVLPQPRRNEVFVPIQ